ncbi:MAG: hypothetical protein HZA25_01545 [Candidatus Niyogibacteria bacterium]|nr:hypothetical protein [Candidatus Niyogibacteria bacterium]
MNKKLSRKEKEKFYIKKMTELQIELGNSIEWNDSANYNFDLSDWTDEFLDKELANTTKELKRQRVISFIEKIWKFFIYLIYIFVILGIIGLLVFGIKQLL